MEEINKSPKEYQEKQAGETSTWRLENWNRGKKENTSQWNDR